MDFGHVLRLDRSRQRLGEERAASRAAVGAQHDGDLAESLRPALREALESLEALYKDEDLWARARSFAEGAPPIDGLADLGGYEDALPALLELFGYNPPPPAQDLVSAAIASLSDVGDAGSPAEEVDQARAALEDLLGRGFDVAASAPPWVVIPVANETNAFLEAGIEIAAATGTGAVGVVVSTVAVGAATGGIGALAGILVIGGVRRLRRSRANREYADELARERRELRIGLLPAARAAVLFHLDEILARQSDSDPLAAIDRRHHLDALADITRRFVHDRMHLTAQVNQADLRGNRAPHTLLARLYDLYGVVEPALAGTIDSARIATLKALRGSIAVLKI